MSAVEASSVRVVTMADGTLRLTVDVEPRFAVDAFRLFGAPGTAVALAALKPGMPEPEQPAAEQKGGALAILAGRWCNEMMFQTWLQKAFPQPWKVREEQSLRSIAPRYNPATVAANVVRDVCGVQSRAELDHNADAAEKFHRLIRGPYSKHLIAAGVTVDV